MPDRLTRLQRTEIRWGALALSAVMTAWCLWYLADAVRASTRLQNLIFIAPGTVITVLLFLLVLARSLRRTPDEAVEEEPAVVKSTAIHPFQPLLVMILLLVYSVSLTRVGFDLATFFFIAAVLVVEGERRPLFVLLYSAIFSGLIVWGFKSMLTLDLPTWIV